MQTDTLLIDPPPASKTNGSCHITYYLTVTGEKLKIDVNKEFYNVKPIVARRQGWRELDFSLGVIAAAIDRFKELLQQEKGIEDFCDFCEFGFRYEGKTYPLYRPTSKDISEFLEAWETECYIYVDNDLNTAGDIILVTSKNIGSRQFAILKDNVKYLFPEQLEPFETKEEE